MLCSALEKRIPKIRNLACPGGCDCLPLRQVDPIPSELTSLHFAHPMKVPYNFFPALLMFLPVAKTLTPSTKPEEVLLAQLSSLQRDDMAGVYEYASPANKQQTGDLKRFDEMIREGHYKFLIGHLRSDILLTSNIGVSKQYLVRVLAADANSSSKKVKEYWWSLSRCRSGTFKGCYMVDAVIPNMM